MCVPFDGTTDILMFNNIKYFPKIGKFGCIYVESDPYLGGSGRIFMWNGTKYVQLMSPADEHHKRNNKFKECPHCGSKSFTLFRNYYKCDYCDSMFSYED